MGTNFYEPVIPRLDRGIQLVRGRLPLWIPRSSRGMTVQKRSSPQILFLKDYSILRSGSLATPGLPNLETFYLPSQ
ncbi:MAG: hypothetical protein HYW48_04245 [Deltaproteobacteria bacterium]|nr:hypothetical protein [Deltaproteobacteria bacterium]